MRLSSLENVVRGEGKPILVFELGIGGSIYNWDAFIKKLEKDFTIILYHRAGYGRSEESEKQRNVNNIAEELNALLTDLAIQDPFVLIGHSFGGLCVQQYAKMFPERLKGVILIDSTSYHYQKLYEMDLPVMNSMISLEQMIESNRNSSTKSRAELRTSYRDVLLEAEKDLTKEQFSKYEDFLTNPVLFKTVAEEFANWKEDSEIIRAAGPFPEVPLTVIARDKTVSAVPFIEHGIPGKEAYLYEDMWRELQMELSELTKNAELIIAENSDHEIHKDRPDVIIRCLDKYK